MFTRNSGSLVSNMKLTSLVKIVFIFMSLLHFPLLSIKVKAKTIQEFSMEATGKFDVSLTPQKDDKVNAGRMLIDKTYHGELTGKAVGQMLSKRLENGHASYIAIEDFDGELAGKKGGFTFIHQGHMSAQGQSLVIDIMPGSGTHELSGISGSLVIDIQDGQHFYTFSYSLPE
ncbi:DUF3224 domain-containing protein [Thalassotalea euphylliae]|uniref:DUF3224 domain-containing protein n=1 Tax=Thalassotalea euphylliae TaxID=1655234 RepID=UPI00363C7BBE